MSDDKKTGGGGGDGAANMNLAMFRTGGTGLHFQSRRSPVLGMKGVVASPQPLASQIGIQILNKGGNAVDTKVGALYKSQLAEFVDSVA